MSGSRPDSKRKRPSSYHVTGLRGWELDRLAVEPLGGGAVAEHLGRERLDVEGLDRQRVQIRCAGGRLSCLTVSPRSSAANASSIRRSASQGEANEAMVPPPREARHRRPESRAASARVQRAARARQDAHGEKDRDADGEVLPAQIDQRVREVSGSRRRERDRGSPLAPVESAQSTRDDEHRRDHGPPEQPKADETGFAQSLQGEIVGFDRSLRVLTQRSPRQLERARPVPRPGCSSKTSQACFHHVHR